MGRENIDWLLGKKSIGKPGGDIKPLSETSETPDDAFERLNTRLFFQTQLAFAHTIAQRNPDTTSFRQALFSHTCFYRLFGFGDLPKTADEAEENPGWKSFVDAVEETEQHGDGNRTLTELRKRYIASPHMPIDYNPDEVVRVVDLDGNEIENWFKCVIEEEEANGKMTLVVHIHFENPGGDVEFGKGFLKKMKDELKVAFSSVQKQVQLRKAAYMSRHDAEIADVQVTASSWLLSSAVVGVVFPKAFRDSAKISTDVRDFQRLSTWGQFMDQDGAIKVDEIEKFSASLANLPEEADIWEAFTFPTMQAHGPIEDFYAFLKMESETGPSRKDS